MFREMRRKRQLLPPEERVAILERMTNGTLALHGDDKYRWQDIFSLCHERTQGGCHHAE